MCILCEDSDHQKSLEMAGLGYGSPARERDQSGVLRAMESFVLKFPMAHPKEARMNWNTGRKLMGDLDAEGAFVDPSVVPGNFPVKVTYDPSIPDGEVRLIL